MEGRRSVRSVWAEEGWKGEKQGKAPANGEVGKEHGAGTLSGVRSPHLCLPLAQKRQGDCMWCSKNAGRYSLRG